jgi:methanogenic corrinoid protein MtbC1
MAALPLTRNQEDTPIYTIRTVVERTGIAPATLRAWERRYGILSPGRSGGGYRLYSERDIAILRWLKGRVDTGIPISRAVALLEYYHQLGQAPELATRQAEAALASGPRSQEALSSTLLELLLAFDEAAANRTLAEAFALYPLEMVAEEIIGPVLVEVGERWHRGEASIIQEHFATAFLRHRLSALFHVYEQPAVGPLAITASAPAEWHDVGILIVSLALRCHGWRVIYLGQNVPAENLLQEVSRLRPNLVCLSAAMRSNALSLIPIADAMGRLQDPRPRLALGGRAFNLNHELREHFPGVYIGVSARALLTALACPTSTLADL